MKALLCRLRCDKELVAMEHKHGWETLLTPSTMQEMRHVLIPFCCHIAFHLLKPLSRDEPHWDLPFLAFLVEVLKCLDLSKYGDSILEMMSRYLLSDCRQRCRLALRGLVVLSKDPTMDNSHVQLLSIHLFSKVMELVVDEGKKPLKTIVNQSLYPLLIYWDDENLRVAKASRETLICAAKFLKRRDLEQLLKKKQRLKFAECLLAEDRSRAAERLRQALPFVESPQESLREAAIRFIGIAGRHLRGQQEELQLLCEALQALRRDDSPSQTNIIVQEIFSKRAAELHSCAGSEEPESL
ncbi:uncharacterized protein [Aphelocoma coerulescens]|uniref:uncharacterized protein n=1 Tax=Aphelocoma coerulescens TaxID=39617 RepID=UPI0036043CB2